MRDWHWDFLEQSLQYVGQGDEVWKWKKQRVQLKVMQLKNVVKVQLLHPVHEADFAVIG